MERCILAKKHPFFVHFWCKFIRLCKLFFKHFSSFFFYAEFKSFFRLNLWWAVLEIFNCKEPQNRFFKKFRKPSLKELKNKKKIKNRFRPLFGCITRWNEQKIKFDHRSSFEFCGPFGITVGEYIEEKIVVMIQNRLRF